RRAHLRSNPRRGNPKGTGAVTSCPGRPTGTRRTPPTSRKRLLHSGLNMANWPSTRASRVLRTLQRAGWPDVVFSFHDGEEIGPRMLARIAKRTGLKPEDM